MYQAPSVLSSMACGCGCAWRVCAGGYWSINCLVRKSPTPQQRANARAVLPISLLYLGERELLGGEAAHIVLIACALVCGENQSLDQT